MRGCKGKKNVNLCGWVFLTWFLSEFLFFVEQVSLGIQTSGFSQLWEY